MTARAGSDETVHVFAIDLPLAEAARLTEDHGQVAQALGGGEVDMDRVEVIDPRALGEIGLSGYLTDGEGVDADAVLPDEPRLDSLRKPVLVARPGALGRAFEARHPLTWIGSYPLEQARPAGDPIRTPSAEGTLTGTPSPDTPPEARSAQGTLAVGAILVVAAALLIWFLI